jgi:hypothetical protein
VSAYTDCLRETYGMLFEIDVCSGGMISLSSSISVTSSLPSCGDVSRYGFFLAVCSLCGVTSWMPSRSLLFLGSS